MASQTLNSYNSLAETLGPNAGAALRKPGLARDRPPT